MNRIYLITIGIWCLSSIMAQTVCRFTISGYVKEDISGELLTGVSIYIPEFNTGIVSNNYGFYSITLPQKDSITVQFSYVGFNTRIFRLSLNKNLELNIFMGGQLQLEEVVVNYPRADKLSESVMMSSVNVPVSQIKSIPSLLGEKDVLKVLQLMPGVQKGTEGSSGLYIRGGSPDQNLFILDDAIIYNVSHLFGFFSLFNGDALKSIELTKGGFPARYGGRLSSVIDMNMKEGNKEHWHGEGGIGLISSRFEVEGPLLKDKCSILFSGRRTYLDLLFYPVSKEIKTGYFFYDFNAKINYDFGSKNKLFLSGYFGRDKFYFKHKNNDINEKGGFYWGNTTGTLRWNHLYSNRLFSNTSLIFSKFKFDLYNKLRFAEDHKDYNAEYYSSIQDLTLKNDIDFFPDPKHWIKTGFITTFHYYKPYAYIEEDRENLLFVRNFKTNKGWEAGYYIEDIFQPLQKLKIDPGIRFTYFITNKKQYWNLEPRISAAWRFKDTWAWKASYAEMNQYIHLLTNTGLSLPTDLWVPSTEKIKPQNSRQIATGLVKDIENTNKRFSISLEGYYKTMKNLIGYKEGASFISLDDPETANEISWENNVTVGRGWSYGIEFLLQKKTGRLSGWVGYTLSWSQLRFDSLNLGRKFYARYDRRHDISVVSIFKISGNITLAATWVFGSGNVITIPLSEYGIYSHLTFPNYNIAKDYSEKNNMRMAPYQRLDIGIQLHKKSKHGERIWEISVYNAYNRHNPFYYYKEVECIDGKEYGRLKQIALFPLIPSVSYSFTF